MQGTNQGKARRLTKDAHQSFAQGLRPEIVVRQGSLHPFKRAAKLYTKIMEMRAACPPGKLLQLQEALGALPPYVSRGHGRKPTRPARRIGGAWSQDRSKPYPNPGRSEAARRVFQSLRPWERKLAREIEAGL
ncbi:MAG: hypothetical protein NUV51_11630 [Sulfuricaulis sp.]|nr:hypothetical protein [Sulfuricaulis sp.]